ncbi:MAG: PIG-L family deacetylase [Abditibacteriota bacterium]|nr:PIG-L family deacetylase [Abditibacteriota bacterium]
MRILAIGAHLDDIELACGGSLAKAVKKHHTVRAVILSRSGYTNIKGEIQRFDEDAVKEGTEALNTLGITDISIHDLPAKDIEFCSETVEIIEKASLNARGPSSPCLRERA